VASGSLAMWEEGSGGGALDVLTPILKFLGVQVDALGGGPMTPADLFFYLDLDESDPYSNSGAESTVGSSRSIPAQRLNDGWDTGPGAFNVTRAALAPALAVLQPVAVAIHAEAEATGRFASISSSGDCACPSARARPQLLKLQRCYALVTEHEKQRGWRYAWIARARPDLGWLWPLPAAALFDHRFVYVPANYWPMGDQVGMTSFDGPCLFFALSLIANHVESRIGSKDFWLLYEMYMIFLLDRTDLQCYVCYCSALLYSNYHYLYCLPITVRAASAASSGCVLSSYLKLKRLRGSGFTHTNTLVA